MEIPKRFPEFSLTRLLRAVFEPRHGERMALLIDLDEPRRMRDFSFVNDPALPIQRTAYEVFYRGLAGGGLEELGLLGGDMFAYKITGGSNLDLPREAMDANGRAVSLDRDIYRSYDIILCISTFSATAPLTAFAKRFGFRGATLHGINDMILRTGLAVDYNRVSRDTEKLRLGLTRADSIEFDFEVVHRRHSLNLILGRQEAQKSHGLARGKTPDIVNLPAGEVYFVPRGAEGRFPMKYEDGTIGLMEVAGGRIVNVTLIVGNREVVRQHQQRIMSDPATGWLGELGLGTQRLPWAGRDIQDEKILGTAHIATGRNDHLGGDLTPDKFNEPSHATHDDILFAPHKTPEIRVPEVRMCRDGKTVVLLRDYEPAEYIASLLGDLPPDAS